MEGNSTFDILLNMTRTIHDIHNKKEVREKRNEKGAAYKRKKLQLSCKLSGWGGCGGEEKC